jgi:hypothetical protein
MSLKDVGSRAAELAEKELVIRVLRNGWNRKEAASPEHLLQGAPQQTEALADRQSPCIALSRTAAMRCNLSLSEPNLKDIQ